jgi:hypothetical protein
VEPPAPLPAFEHASPEDRAAQLLFFREHGFTSVRGLAAAMQLRVAVVELLLCRGLVTLLLRGYPSEWLCEIFSVSPQQLARAGAFTAFGESFQPIGVWRRRRAGAPEPPVPGGWLAAAEDLSRQAETTAPPEGGRAGEEA